MNDVEWRKRILNRNDMTLRVTHLTRDENDEKAFDRLWKILLDKKLISSVTGYINGICPVCCFQDTPLLSIAENLQYEDDNGTPNQKYSWFGIRLNKKILYNMGARPVIYENTIFMKNILSPNEYWRIVSLDLDYDSIIDWTYEREWRMPKDCIFEYYNIGVLVKDNNYYKKFITRCIEENKLDMLSQINELIPLKNLLQ